MCYAEFTHSFTVKNIFTWNNNNQQCAQLSDHKCYCRCRSALTSDWFLGYCQYDRVIKAPLCVPYKEIPILFARILCHPALIQVGYLWAKACKIQPEYKMRKMNHNQHNFITCIHTENTNLKNTEINLIHCTMSAEIRVLVYIITARQWLFLLQILTSIRHTGVELLL